MMLRHPSVSERGWAWAIIATLTIGLAAGLVALVAAGILPDPGGAFVRGYTATGYVLGGLVVLAGAFAFAYSLRKRSLQESFFGRGSMMAWLWLHIALGGLGIGLAVLHAGWGLVSYYLSTGKVLFWAYVGLVVTGIGWRLAYRFVPPRVAAKVGNYSVEGTRDRIVEVDTEIEKLAAGRSEAFRALCEWYKAEPRDEQEAAHHVAQAGMTPEDHEAWLQVRALCESRWRATKRVGQQIRLSRWQQGWRWAHVPLALAIVPLLIAHMVGAPRLPERLIPIASQPHQFSSFADSRACKSCHAEIYDQWKSSMHAHGMASPVMIAQANQVLREVLDDADEPDPKLICVNCHGPVGIILTDEKQGILPLERDGYEGNVMDGIDCVSCHQQDGDDPDRGEAGLTKFFSRYDKSGAVYYGPYDDPVGNAYHQSAKGEIYDDATRMCVSCHNVVYDKNDDGEIEKGVDLILQETTLEYDEYRDEGGQATCLDCHMPRDDRDRSAESAHLYFDQDGEAPDRRTRDHSFVAVDYPLDVAPEDDPQADKRKALQRSAATLTLATEGNTLLAAIQNTGCGHNLPTGLAFARQMWLEVQAFDVGGRVLFSSGVLKDTDDDLCDENTMSDDLGKFVRGCERSDPHLVNFQLKLMDVVDTKKDESGKEVRDDDGDRILVAAEGAKESCLQRLTAGAVPRKRPVDGQLFAPIEPEEERVVKYQLPRGTKRVKVRLLFRSFGPYFLRAIADGQPDDEEPDLEDLVENLQIDEMADKELVLGTQPAVTR